LAVDEAGQREEHENDDGENRDDPDEPIKHARKPALRSAAGNVV
jgi:hypothetical protein